MGRRAAIGMAVFAGLVAIATPVGVAVYWAWKQSLNAEFAAVTSIAEDVLRRGEESRTEQSLMVLKVLEEARASDPCSAQNIRLMARLDLQSAQVHAVGYVRNSRLLCSSFGRHDSLVGLPAYTTLYGTQVRPSVEFAILPGVAFFLNTDPRTGYSAAIHPHLPLDVFVADPEVSVGLISYSGERLLINRGAFKPQWPQALGNANAAQLSDGEHLVVMRRSPRYGFVAFAAHPEARVIEGLRRTALLLVPIGAAAGIVLALAVLYAARRLLALPAVMKLALKHDEFFLLYQPIVELQGGRCVGAEALIRWRQQGGEIMRPDVFIPVAEETGLIREITGRVLVLIAREAATLLKQRPGFHIGINLSSQDLEAPDMPGLIREFMAAAGIQPSNVLVEATERGFMNADLARRVVNDIRALNVKVAIDDFGTGYSSLSHLEKLKLDYLKIDKSFVDTMGGDTATGKVAIHIIEMAKALKLGMIAEGVETEAQLKFLQAHGVQYAQGYYFSKPLPLRQLAAYAHSSDRLAT